ncbi:DinB family protein [Spirosoma sp. KNUC1025]|uniref:DinB family protein n=1 Tax=Spirosoma sp. KNUC1025 TaxID=2894082 RepID=UPI003865CA67|nr:DinB family protein [Spirosoma sp. KNUC1025]
MENTKQLESALDQTVLSAQQLLDHWQGHRRLTRKLIEAYPADQFFSYALGGMRPCSELIAEIMGMSSLGIQGVVSGRWDNFQPLQTSTKEQVLAHWDQVTEQINTLWPQIQPSHFQEVDVAFGQYEGTIYWFILYVIDNEIHHRAQAYVYLRTLGIAPPAFWDRS